MAYIIIFIIMIVYCGIDSLYHLIRSMGNSDKRQAKILEKLSKIIVEDNKEKQFNRQNYGEAFADNFARMYGYGSQLMSGLNKLSIKFDEMHGSWYNMESKREDAIFNITRSMLKDEHKTDIHRIKSLLDEYQADIDDPNTPPEVKKMLQDDQKELKLVLNKYLNNMSDFQNKVNKTIAEGIGLIVDDIDKEDPETPSPEDSQSEVKQESYYSPISYSKLEDFCRSNAQNIINITGGPMTFSYNEFNEFGFQFNDDYITESKKAREKIQKEIDAITPSERSEFYKIFGRTKQCSLAKDKDGYYVRTHRARSKSKKEIKDITKKEVDFISSTS